MSDEPYLIAHKVRGEAAFDVAIKQDCAICHGMTASTEVIALSCDECDGQGYWWIVATSGHRAYPFWDIELEALIPNDEGIYHHGVLDFLAEMPETLADHYHVNPSPRTKPSDIGRSLLAKLGLGRSAAPIKRRI